MNPQTFPTFADYQSALQHPEMAFSSNFLSKGLVESDLWGFPRVRSGGFALTYKIALREMTWATRCFHRVVRDRATRYSQICKSLEEYQLPFFVPTRYIQHGITVQGKHFPISILQWIEGDSLETFIFHHLNESDCLYSLAEKFRDVCQLMEDKGIAHGDLSHRNILVKSNEIYLIDYDGMFVPSLTGKKSCELGNIHFQHPLRNTTIFDNHLDRFSTIVIYLSIMALAADPYLWQRFQSGGEGLLFQRSDFLDPLHSRLLRALENNPATARFIPRFRQICLSPVQAIPSLEELLFDQSYTVDGKPDILEIKSIKQPNIPVLDALKKKDIYQAEGKIVVVVGRISEVFHGHSDQGEDHVFIDFGNWQEKCFTAVLWNSVLKDVFQLDFSLDSWVGQWMSVSGLISIRDQRPQIQVEAVTDIVLLPSEDSAFNLLKRNMNNSVLEKKKRSMTSIQSINREIVKPSSIPTTHFSENPVINLSDVFNTHKNPSIDNVLNQLYSSDRFKK